MGAAKRKSMRKAGGRRAMTRVLRMKSSGVDATVTETDVFTMLKRVYSGLKFKQLLKIEISAARKCVFIEFDSLETASAVLEGGMDAPNFRGKSCIFNSTTRESLTGLGVVYVFIYISLYIIN